MRHTLTIEKFLILNILKRHPGITRYSIMKLMLKLKFPIAPHTFYRLVKILLGEGLVKCYDGEKFTKEISCKGKGNNGWWNRRTRKVTLYSLTDKGFKELIKLEFKLRIAMTLTIGEEKV